MRVAILAAGTRGDVQPVLAIGDELARRGHSVVVAVNDDLTEWVGRTGLEVVPTGLDVGRFLHSAQAREFLAHGRIGATLRRIVADERRVNDAIVAACVRAAEGADLVLTTLMTSFRGRCLREATGVAHRALHYFPALPTGDWSGIVSGVRDLPFPALNRATGRLFERMLWSQTRAMADEMCDTLGIARFRRPPSGDLPALQLYSGHVAPTPADWPPGSDALGWTRLSPSLRRRLGEDALPDDLVRWLDAGPPPVYFGFGSMPVLDPGRLLRGVAEVTERRGLRGLVAAGWTDYGEAAEALPPHLFLAPSVFDHDAVLPRCVAAVHHGGAGTTAATLRAGIPSVVAAVFVDQPYWGWRLARIGAGVTMPFRRLGPDRLGTALDEVLREPYAARAAEIGALVRGEDAAGAAVDVLERRAGVARSPST